MRSTAGRYAGSRPLRAREKSRLALLGLPTLGLALSITIVSTYLPTVGREFTSSTLALGAVVGGEGVMGLWVPLVVGPWSDRLRTRVGGRLPFLIVGVPVMAGALLALGLLHTIAAIAAAAAVFFMAYFVAYEPYRALYPDLVGDSDVAGRAQSAQAVWRGAGTGLALLAGGLLLSGTRLLPFALAALALCATTGAFAVIAIRHELAHAEGSRDMGTTRSDESPPVGEVLSRQAGLRSYLAANMLCELALAAVKTFVVLYLTEGLGLSLVTAALIVGGTGGLIFAGAAVGGRLGDAHGRLRVMRWALWLYGLGFAVPMCTTAKPLIAAVVPAIAIAGGAVMALSYAILMPLMPTGDRGALTGYYSLSRGIGVTLGPVAAGGLISLTAGGPFDDTHGFQAMWGAPLIATLASLVLLRHAAKHGVGEQRESPS